MGFMPETDSADPRDRMLIVLEAIKDGLRRRKDCWACRDTLADRCPECERTEADIKKVRSAITVAEDAETEDEAFAVGLRTVLAVSELDEATAIRLLRLAGTGTGAEQGGAA